MPALRWIGRIILPLFVVGILLSTGSPLERSTDEAKAASVALDDGAWGGNSTRAGNDAGLQIDRLPPVPPAVVDEHSGMQIKPMPRQEGSQPAVAALAARSLAGGGQVDLTLAPNRYQGEASLEQGPGVSLFTDLASGCERVEGMDPPTLDCSLLAGSSFNTGLRAEIDGAVPGTGPDVEISLALSLANTTLQRLDDTGTPVSGPVAASGQVNATLGFVPDGSQVTAGGAPLVLDVEARAPSVDPNAVARVRYRFHVLPAGSQNIVGFMFDDTDGSGQRDLGEPGIAGWTLQLETSGGIVTEANSDDAGRFVFESLVPGEYSARMVDRAGWTATRPSEVQLQVLGASEGSIIELLFGAREIQAGNPAPVIVGRLQTDRGCADDSVATLYRIGETMQVFLEANGVSEADVSLRQYGADGSETVLLDRRRIPGAQAFSFGADAGSEEGDYRLLLQVFDVGNSSPDPDFDVWCRYGVQSNESATISFDPANIAFGPAPIGGETQSKVLLTNTGRDPLRINSAAIQGGGAAPFAIRTQGLSGLVIPPGGSHTVELSYRPITEGGHQDFLLFRCNAQNQPLVTIPLSGYTSSGPQASSAYIQTDRGCLETGQSPLYFVGDPIQLNMRINSELSGEAQARIEDITPNGQTRVIFSRNVATNKDLTLGGARIYPPVGNEAVRLTAQVAYEMAYNECSFRVAAGGTRIEGYKFHDLNQNGIWDGCPLTPWIPGSEPPIEGWGMHLTGPENYVTQTDADGRFEFVVSVPGSYTVTEATGAGWQPTRAPAYTIQVGCYPGECIPPVLFGNQCGEIIPPGPGPHPTASFPTPGWPTQMPGTPTATVVVPTPTPGGAPVACNALISPRPGIMNVGQRADFRVDVTGGGQVLGYQWEVDGEVLRDYSEGTRLAWSTQQMQPADYQRQTLGFFWKPDADQRHPQNAGPRSRGVRVTVTTAQGICSTEHVLNIERNNTNVNRQAEDFYTTNHNATILTEHTLWHSTNPFAGFGYNGTLFFDFHRQYINRYNSWRSEFGFPPVGVWDSGTTIPRGVEVDHASRSGTYTPQPKPNWFTIGGIFQRPYNGLPCDTTGGGQRRLRDYPSDRRLLGCAVTHTWHNGVHTGIGGDMLNPQWSPRDPIFWRWHAFVDIVSQERMGVLSLADIARGPVDHRVPSPDEDRMQSGRPPHLIYQEPFRLYRFLDRLDELSVEFDQNVIGLKASDLTINGNPATELVVDGGRRFVFSGFPEPEFGKVDVRLKPGAIKNIQNQAFEGDAWTYFRVDPALDVDRDGLTSRDEIYTYFTDPTDRDSDDDGLSDGDEVQIYETRPLMADSDRDGAGDKCEIEAGSNPNDPADTAENCPISSIFVCYIGNGDSIER